MVAKVEQFTGEFNKEYVYNSMLSRDYSNFSKFINLIYLKGYVDCFTEFSNQIKGSYSEENTSSEQDKGIYNIIMEIIRTNSLSGSSQEDGRMIALSKYYKFNDKREVYNFIKENDNLINFLLEAYLQIENVFGKDIEVTLKKKEDPEIASPLLVAYINTSHLSVRDARKKLKEFKFDWYLKNNEITNGRFVVHVT